MEQARQGEPSRAMHPDVPLPAVSKLSLGSARPRRLRVWLDALPISEPRRSAPLLLTLLDELARLRVDERRRLALLEEVRPRVYQLVDTLESRYLNQPLAPPEPALEAVTVCHRLLQGMAAAYQNLAVTLLRGRLSTPSRQAAATALQRAMDARAGDVFLYLLLYSSPPENAWRALHSLYAVTEQYALESITVADAELPGQEGSALFAYVRLLLTASAQPNQLRQSALLALYHAAAYWARWVPLSGEPGNAFFQVDLQQGTGPQVVAAGQVDGALRYFNTRPLAAALSEDGPVRYRRPLSGVLSHHLRWVWLGSRQRRVRRWPVNQAVQLRLGLDAVHRQFDSAGDDHHQSLYQAWCVDQGEDGYCLEWQGETPPGLRAGGLLALNWSEPGWRVGEISWVAWQQGVLRLGVVLLPRNLRAVRVSAGDAHAWAAPALLIPAVDGDVAGTLVVPTTGYQQGTQLVVWDDAPWNASLGARLRGSPDISQYALCSVD